MSTAQGESRDTASKNTTEFRTGIPSASAGVKGELVLSDDILSEEERDQGTSSLHNGPVVLVALSIPALMTAPDFCLFVRPMADIILHLRMLHYPNKPNQYMVALKFRTREHARSFAKQYHGKVYLQGLIQDTCVIAAVQEVHVQSTSEADESVDVGGASISEPLPFTDVSLFPNEAEPTQKTNASEETVAVVNDAPGSPCPVCLEPMVATESPLFTTICNHTMHALCLAQWDLNSCPVCRHTQELTPEATCCMSCGHSQELWMCVVCAYVGCGIYAGKHAQKHFEETQHPFAMNLEEFKFWTGEKIVRSSVWDYVSERFVARLLTSEDGKIVEVDPDDTGPPGGSSTGDRADSAASAPGSSHVPEQHATSRAGATCGGTSKRGRSSLDAGIEYDDDGAEDRAMRAAIYASRMDAVVSEYKERMERMEDENKVELASLQAEVQRLRDQNVQADAKLRQTMSELEAAKDDAKQYRKQQSRKLGDAEKEIKDLKDKNGFLKNLNETLLRDKQSWKEQLDGLKENLREKERECREKDEEIRDVMLHLDAQSSVSQQSPACRTTADGPSDASGGDIVGIGPSPRQRLAMRTRRR